MNKGCRERIEAIYRVAEIIYLSLWGLFFLLWLIHFVVPGGDKFDDWAHFIGVYGILPGTLIGLILIAIKQGVEDENW